MTRQSMDRTFADGLERDLVDRVRRVRDARLAHTGTRRRANRDLAARVAVAGLVVIAVAASVGVGMQLLRPADRPIIAAPTAAPTPAAPSPAPSISVDGSPVPYAGAVPFAGVTASDRAATRLGIAADGDLIHSLFGTCGLPAERVQVTETTTTVGILVAGYADPLPAGEVCAAVGHTPQPLIVRLSSPIGDRTVIDEATGERRAVTFG